MIFTKIKISRINGEKIILFIAQKTQYCKQPIFPKLKHKFNGIPIKISTGFVENAKQNLKCI